MVVILALLPILVKAQTFWSVVEDDAKYNKSHLTDQGLFQDSIILISGFVSDESCPYHNLSAYNLAGKKLWNVRGYHDLICTDSNYIYTAGFTPLDDISNVGQIVISKYDNHGNKIFSNGYPELPTPRYFGFKSKSIDITGDGTILVSSDKSVVKSNVNGAKITEYKIPGISDIEAVTSLNPLSYFIVTHNKIYKSDSAFIILDSIRFIRPIKKMIINNDILYTLLDSSLVRVNASLNIIDTLISASVEFKNIEFYNKDLWVQTVRPDIVELINIHGREIRDIFNFPVLVNNMEFIVAGSNYIFAGNSFTDQIGIYSYKSSNQGTVNFNLPDIELVDFNIDSIAIDYVSTSQVPLARGYRFNTELSIKNTGKDIIRSFAVFNDLHGGVNCVQNYLYQKLTDLNILPGQTHTFKLKRAYEEGINNRLCFQCMAPNSGLEANIRTNSLCKTFTITDIKNLNKSDIKVYPNPFSNYLKIENPELVIKNIEIVDIRGGTVINRKASEQKITIETNSFKPGFYILKIIKGEKMITQLIIKK